MGSARSTPPGCTFPEMPARHLYTHVPFCARRCSYCDFAIAVRRYVPVDEFLTTLERELAMRVPDPIEADTVYLGGGTPSMLGSAGISRLLDLVNRFVRLADGAEVTMEANPDDVTSDAAQGWCDAGVTRVSLGTQSFDSGALVWMHRTHKSWQNAIAVERLREAGIQSISLDLIFALPEALRRDWERDLDAALALSPDHLSLYGLTVEPATPLARWVSRGSTVEAPEERFEGEFLRADEVLTSSGYEHYEVSNYALPGARSRHNSCYWSRAPYLGTGPSAHSFDGRMRCWNVAPYAEWVRRLGDGRSAQAGEEILSAENVEAESIYLGLRTDRGIVIDQFGGNSRSPFTELDTMTAPLLERVAPWITAGWAVLEEERLRLTPRGWLRLDALASDLTQAASRLYI